MSFLSFLTSTPPDGKWTRIVELHNGQFEWQEYSPMYGYFGTHQASTIEALKQEEWQRTAGTTIKRVVR